MCVCVCVCDNDNYVSTAEWVGPCAGQVNGVGEREREKGKENKARDRHMKVDLDGHEDAREDDVASVWRVT